MTHGGARPRVKLFTVDQVKDAVLSFPAGDAHSQAVAQRLGVGERAANAYLHALVDERLAYREQNGRYICFVVYPAFDPRTWA